MRRALDAIYQAAMVGACLAMVTIASLVLVQVAGRMIDRVAVWLGMGRLGISIPSLAEIGGFLFVAAAFLALPATFRAAGHVRVTLALRFFGPLGNRILAAVVLIIAALLAGFLTWYAILQAIDAFDAGRVSYGLIRMPLWVPQSVMALGLVIFTLAILDELVAALRGNDPAFRAAERARDIGGSD